MRLPTQSHLIPDELWLAARIVERRCTAVQDNAEANGLAAEIILSDKYFATLVASMAPETLADPIVDQAIALIRRYTAPLAGDPLHAPLPEITRLPELPDLPSYDQGNGAADVPPVRLSDTTEGRS